MVLGRDFSNEQLVLMVVGVEKQNVIITKSLFKQIEWIKGDMFNLISLEEMAHMTFIS